MKRILAVSLFVPIAAWASEPGEPLDCSDWVGDTDYPCVEVLDCSTAGAPFDRFCKAASSGNSLIDAAGRLIFLDIYDDWSFSSCGGSSEVPLWRFQLWAVGPRPGQSHTIGYFESRCGVTGTADQVRVRLVDMDHVRGRLVLAVGTECWSGGPYCPYGAPFQGESSRLVVIRGFPLLQDYLPQP